MGEYADMMLEGDVCGTCGEYMDGEGDGIPRYCSAACDPHHDASDEPEQYRRERQPRKLKPPAARLQSVADKMIAVIERELFGYGGGRIPKRERKELSTRLREIAGAYFTEATND